MSNKLYQSREEASNRNRWIRRLAVFCLQVCAMLAPLQRLQAQEQPARSSSRHRRADSVLSNEASGRADLLDNNRISIETLAAWLTKRVKELTGNEQSPVMLKPGPVPDFPVAIRK